MTDTATLLDWLAAFLIVSGAFFSLVAGVGLFVLPDLLARMHAAAKPQVLGLVLILFGAGVRIFPDIDLGMLVLAAIVAGSKVSTKLDVLNSLSQICDQLIVGGGIANTFLAAAGYKVGKSLHEADLIDTAKAIAAKVAVPLPVDVVVAKDELAIPPPIQLEQAKGFSLYMLRAIISGRGDEVIELAKTNWLR